MRPRNMMQTNTLTRPGNPTDSAGVLRPGSYSEQLLSRAISNIQRIAYKYAASEGSASSNNTFMENGNHYNFFFPKVSTHTDNLVSPLVASLNYEHSLTLHQILESIEEARHDIAQWVMDCTQDSVIVAGPSTAPEPSPPAPIVAPAPATSEPWPVPGRVPAIVTANIANPHLVNVMDDIT